MLRHIDEATAADHIMRALADVLTAGRVRTRDLGGTASTTAFAEEVCQSIGRRA